MNVPSWATCYSYMQRRDCDSWRGRTYTIFAKRTWNMIALASPLCTFQAATKVACLYLAIKTPQMKCSASDTSSPYQKQASNARVRYPPIANRQSPSLASQCRTIRSLRPCPEVELNICSLDPRKCETSGTLATPRLTLCVMRLHAF